MSLLKYMSILMVMAFTFLGCSDGSSRTTRSINNELEQDLTPPNLNSTQEELSSELTPPSMN